MKPLCRWLIGNCSELALEIFHVAVRKFKIYYGDKFDVVVCYNNLDPKLLKNINETLYEQKIEECPIKFKQKPEEVGSRDGSVWKFCPSRLRLNSHELWLDNDIIFDSKIPTIDQWLESDSTIISKGIHGVYGMYDGLITEKVCAGLFGIPPYYDLEEEIKKNAIQQFHYGWDEQGLTSLLMTKYNKCMIIPFSELDICEHKLSNSPVKHFVGINRTLCHQPWNNYKALI